MGDHVLELVQVHLGGGQAADRVEALGELLVGEVVDQLDHAGAVALRFRDPAAERAGHQVGARGGGPAAGGCRSPPPRRRPAPPLGHLLEAAVVEAVHQLRDQQGDRVGASPRQRLLERAVEAGAGALAVPEGVLEGGAGDRHPDLERRAARG